MKQNRSRKIRDAGYEAFTQGLPIDLPPSITREMDRMAWEMGWREAKREANRAAGLPGPIRLGQITEKRGK